ncbi:flagellar hook-length control protein FliK [Methylobacterium indicum]|uniref:flagellar hook-length control protein FliK n=1 Tax=Methylobacterium indicum TaxID=1775910 RepID=UPI0009E33D2F|nr:flagellar hook-length control protein FliK [Methylobacterium indicum]
MQISAAGEGGRMTGREPARPVRAAAHELFRPTADEAARASRLARADAASRARTAPDRTDTSSLDRSRTEASDAEAKAERARTADQTARSRAQDARQEARDEARADEARTEAVRARKALDRKTLANKTLARDSADPAARRADDHAGQAEARKPAAGPPAQAGAAAQAEAVHAAAAAGEGTGEIDPDDETEVENAAGDAPPGSLLALLAAPAPASPATAGAAVTSEGGATANGPGIAAAGKPAVPVAADPATERRSETGEGAAAAPAGQAMPDPSAAQAGAGIGGIDAKSVGAKAGLEASAGPEAKGAAAGADTVQGRPAVSVQAPLSAVPMTVGMRALSGTNRFEIRLDPIELGRIDVRLDIDREHGVKAHLVVERPETLALLQRDAGSLQQALAQAGLNPGDGALSFSLRDEGGRNPQREQTERPPGTDRPGVEAAEERQAALAPLRSLARPLDLRI